MKKKLSSEVQILLVIFFAMVSLATISAFVGGTVQPQGVYAQAIPTPTPKTITITDETLQAFGLPLNPVHLADSSSFNLQVIKNTNVITRIAQEAI